MFFQRQEIKPLTHQNTAHDSCFHPCTLDFLHFCDVISSLTVKVNSDFLCLTVLKAATCRVKVTDGTPRRWPRQFRSTMIPSTPCTSPELASTSASPPADSLFSLSFYLLFASLSLSLSLSSSFTSLFPCSLSLSLHTHSTHFSESAPKRLLDGKNLLRLDVQQVFVFKGTISNQRSQLSRLSNQQSSTANPEGFQCAKEKQTIHTYYKLSHYFKFFFLFECLHSCVCKIH